MKPVKISNKMIRPEILVRMRALGLDVEPIYPSPILRTGVPLGVALICGLVIGGLQLPRIWLWALGLACLITFIVVRFRSAHFVSYILQRRLMGAYLFQEAMDKWGEGTPDGAVAAVNAADDYCGGKFKGRLFRWIPRNIFYYARLSILSNTELISLVAYPVYWYVR